MDKFYIGQPLLVRGDAHWGNYLKNFIGKVVLVTEVSNDGLACKFVWEMGLVGEYVFDMTYEGGIKGYLQSGDKVVYRSGEARFVLAEIDDPALFSKLGERQSRLNVYNKDLLRIVQKDNHLDIMYIYRDGKLVWEREEKTAAQFEIEAIEAEMLRLSTEQKNLATRISVLKG